MSAYQNILLGVDVYGPEVKKPFHQACAYARDNDAIFHIATVLNTKGTGTLKRMDPKLKELKRQAYETLETYQQQAEEAGVSNVKMILDTGSPKARITQHLAPEYDIDLLVVGATQGNKVENLLLGSVAEGVVREAKCDVLTVRENLG
ncbi:nucleotide-binding universal stress UspA family protein [Geomicrobium halophilum]|uniref:Nucleotide-binding universal stress UspA family protein n=1 Tax=Geomicrobium halophilum TaxID=549000 RepID=A0A841PSY7_9BACL|nr:universal stress protein [Geomicrobium halophilum]MBB6450306.1 nucleotide-binding universal stress UspA family protein [Geomicrobium halophilum]